MNFRLLAGVAFGSLLFAQAPARQEQPPTTFRGGVNEVIVPVTVTDEKGRFVTVLVPLKASENHLGTNCLT